ncbi:DNA-binding protein creA [Erysiphe necator]|nr:DNA-binding protein creA [Erysiphe necator]
MDKIDIFPPMIEASRTTGQRQDLPRPYKCPLCEKSFHRLEHQTRHIRTHTGEKPHRCSHPGCIKRFSRSDELTRHLRIHINPNSRRSGRMPQQPSTVSSSVLKGRERHLSMVAPMPSLHKIGSRSAPVSTIASPNLSPTTSFSSFVRTETPDSSLPFIENPVARQNAHCSSKSVGNGNGIFNLDMNLLASAAIRVEGNHSSNACHLPRYNKSCCDLSAYKSRSHFASSSLVQSHPPPTLDKLNHCIKRYMKRSRTDSPSSTAPSSPTFSHDSLSPTPDDTPLVTPAHSPRLRSHGSGYDLPSLRTLSLYQQLKPALPPMEPQTLDYISHSSPCNNFPCASDNTKTSSSLSDIILQADGTQRKLPCPLFYKISLQDCQGSNENKISSLVSGSLTGNDPQDRMDIAN